MWGGRQAAKTLCLGDYLMTVSCPGLKFQVILPQSVQPGPSWRCLLLTARTDHIIYDHHPSFLRQPIPQEVLESFFSLNDLFFFFFLLSVTQSCRDFISSMKSY